MHLARYELEIWGNRYDFYSEGPKGRIRKTILYDELQEWDRPTFNLAFGDWNETLGQIDDKVVTNNGYQGSFDGNCL